MSWTGLPEEIKFHIIQHLDRETCKLLRLTSRANSLSAAPKLFETVHLTPNTRSFARAREVAASPSLSGHVRNIVYHLGVLDDMHSGFDTFRDDIMRLHHPSGSTEDIMEDILWKYHCYLEEIDGQKDFESRDEARELRDLCQQFVAVESISTTLDEDDPFDPPKNYIGDRTGVHCACSADGPHFSNLFNAVAGKTLTKISGLSMSWHCLPIVAKESLQTVNMTNMSKLAIGLFNSELLELNSSTQQDVINALDALLQASVSSNDYTLELDFDEIPYEGNHEDLQLITQTVFKHCWPGLKKLALQGISATEPDLKQFLDKNGAHLTSLHLDDIEIEAEVVRDIDGNDKEIPGSVVGLFQWIHDNLRLESASISGSFTNRRGESWFVDLEFENPNCLRRDIELWLSHKAPSPVPQEVLEMERDFVGTGWHDIIRPTPAESWCDGSWTWESDLLDLYTVSMVHRNRTINEHLSH